MIKLFLKAGALCMCLSSAVWAGGEIINPKSGSTTSGMIDLNYSHTNNNNPNPTIIKLEGSAFDPSGISLTNPTADKDLGNIKVTPSTVGYAGNCKLSGNTLGSSSLSTYVQGANHTLIKFEIEVGGKLLSDSNSLPVSGCSGSYPVKYKPLATTFNKKVPTATYTGYYSIDLIVL